MECRHNTESRACWCGPRFEQLCPICLGGGCSGCRDGWIDGLTIADPDWPTIIIHNGLAAGRDNGKH